MLEKKKSNVCHRRTLLLLCICGFFYYTEFRIDQAKHADARLLGCWRTWQLDHQPWASRTPNTLIVFLRQLLIS